MRWIAVCFAFAAIAYAAPPPATSPAGDYVRLAQAGCPPPKVYDPNMRSCLCPQGTAPSSTGVCVHCFAPKVVVNGQCVCPEGTAAGANGVCLHCFAPKVVVNGQCRCPPGTTPGQNGGCLQCMRPKVVRDGACVCPPGMFPGPNGGCLCPRGMTLNHLTGQCVKP